MPAYRNMFWVKKKEKTLVWFYFEHNVQFAFSYCSLSLGYFRNFARGVWSDVFFPLTLHIIGLCVWAAVKHSDCLENTIVTLKRWLWLCVFCFHHNNTLQVIIKLEIFFVFLTKNPFLCQHQLWVVIFSHFTKDFSVLPPRPSPR